MTTDALMTDKTAWYPVSLSGGVPAKTSNGTHLFGEEIVVWRDEAGAAHIWEDRCPHRGMRLSLGFVRSDRIACLYHGWQFGTEGRCLYIPAHPKLDVPDTITTNRHSVHEAGGLIWGALGTAEGTPPAVPAIAAGATEVRSIHMDRPADEVAAKLAAAVPTAFASALAGIAATVKVDGPLAIFTFAAGGVSETLVGGVQPLAANRSAIHFVVAGPADYKGAGQRHFSRFAEALRDAIEAAPALAAA